MPDASGQIRGISLSGRAGEAWERVFGPKNFKPGEVVFYDPALALPRYGSGECPGCATRSQAGITWHKPDCPLV